jgi:hypothetical protein
LKNKKFKGKLFIYFPTHPPPNKNPLLYMGWALRKPRRVEVEGER